MKATPFLIFGMAVVAANSYADGPWYNDQGDCQRHWADTFNGSRIRREQDIQELAGIDLRITAAEGEKEKIDQEKQTAAVDYAMLDSKHQTIKDVLLPFLERTVKLCHELQELVRGALAPSVANAKTLLEMANISESNTRPRVSPEVAAGLAMGETDSLALSMILDSTLEHPGRSSEAPTKVVLTVRTTDVGAILSQLESTVQEISHTNEALERTLGELTSENELALTAQRKSEDDLTAALAAAQKKKEDEVKAYNTARDLTQQLRDRKNSLPGMITDEANNMNDAASHRDNQCAGHWAPRANSPGGSDHGHHDGGGRW